MLHTSGQISGKIIIVAGGINSIVPGIVCYCMEQGAIVIVPLISLQQINTLKEYVKNIPSGKLITQLSDTDDYERIFEMAEIIVEEYGKVDIGISVFNCRHHCSKLMNTKINDWQQMIDEEVTPFFISGNILLNIMNENNSALYVSISKENSTENDNDNDPLSKISLVATMEMSKIFSSEAEKLGIRYHHIYTPKTADRLPLQNDKLNVSIGYQTGNQIAKLYSNTISSEENLFILLKENQDGN